MFELFSKLFSKAEPSKPLEATQIHNTTYATSKSSPKEDFIQSAVKIRFAVYTILFLALSALLVICFNSYITKVTKTAIESAQAIMINVVTNQVVIGTLYKDPKEPPSAIIDEELHVNTAPQSKAEPADKNYT